jgi:glycosyltransferase involved in cell wall biosynthesis
MAHAMAEQGVRVHLFVHTLHRRHPADVVQQDMGWVSPDNLLWHRIPSRHKGVELQYFHAIGQPQFAPGQLRLLYVGSLHQHKGIDTLLEAIALLPARFHLDIGGGYPPEALARLRQYVQESPSLSPARALTLARAAMDASAVYSWQQRAQQILRFLAQLRSPSNYAASCSYTN